MQTLDELPLVREEWACPGCSEREMEKLAWIADATVECATCGTQYDPNEEA